MIWFFNLEKASAISCDNYDDLFQYIQRLEALKRQFPLNPPFMHLDTIPRKEEEPTKQWCLEYCKNHNYIVIENTVAANNSSKTSRISQKYPDQPFLTRVS